MTTDSDLLYLAQALRGAAADRLFQRVRERLFQRWVKELDPIERERLWATCQALDAVRRELLTVRDAVEATHPNTAP